MTTHVVPRSQDGPRSKRADILSAAVDKFGRDGFEQTKWATIADEVGIGQTALYHYFESKAHCLLTIMSLELERSLGRFKEVTAGARSPEAKLRAAVSSAYAVTSREALAARILVAHTDLLSVKRASEREEAERQNARRLVRSIEDAWTEMVQGGMNVGAFAERDSRQTALALLALIISVWRSYRPARRRELPETAAFMSDACIRLVGPQPVL